MRTLVLNAGYEPVRVVSWQKAMILLLTEKAELVKSHNRFIRSVSRSFQLPQIIKLKRYIKNFSMAAGGICYSRQNVFKRDKYVCQYCSKKLSEKHATIDHIIPRSKGGSDTWENTVCCCVSCNSKKGSRTLEESQMKLNHAAKRPPVRSSLTDMLEEFDCEEIDMEEIWAIAT
ncbi:MAG: HNH endonuclease [Chitinophagaceae bacterium]|nr:HNH endonuclease [Oligoflexus sp.]